jgi:hypothetical protein
MNSEMEAGTLLKITSLFIKFIAVDSSQAQIMHRLIQKAVSIGVANFTTSK